jgi:hypothetical protein
MVTQRYSLHGGGKKLREREKKRERGARNKLHLSRECLQ